MDTAERVIAIILSSTLAIFLLLGIIALIFVIKIIFKIRKVADKVEHIADKAGAIGDIIERASAPMIAGRLFSRLSKGILKSNDKRRRD
ncbi:MAG: hypothetical protein NVSMB46_06730 [Candidatus Saccharimonadales bacterium]